MKKDIKIKFVVIFSLVALITIIVLMISLKTRVKTYDTWDEYLKEYKDKTINVLGSNNYTNKFILKDKTLYTEDNIKVFDNVMNAYSIKYNNEYYIYLVCTNGNTYYLNNLKTSTQEEFELTQLGDYKELSNIKANNVDIIGTNIKGITYNLTSNMESYIN